MSVSNEKKDFFSELNQSALSPLYILKSYWSKGTSYDFSWQRIRLDIRNHLISLKQLFKVFHPSFPFLENEIKTIWFLFSLLWIPLLGES